MENSPGISQEAEDEYEEEVQQELFDDETEDIIDEDLDGEGDVDEDYKGEGPDGQEGLDLDIGEEDQYETYGQEEECIQEQHPLEPEDHRQGKVVVEVVEDEVCDGDGDLDDDKRHKNEEMVSIEGLAEEEVRNDERKDDPLSQPEHGSEVFVGNISKDTVEEDLRRLCAPCGDIFEVRVMRDKDKQENSNKGFAFVTFANKEIALTAIETLNDREFKGRKLRFSPSQLKNKLFVGNVPKSWSSEDLQKVLSEKAQGMLAIELLKDPHNSDRNRGFAFVEYYNHACAENAKRLLSVPGFKLGTNIPTINWAECPTGLDNPGSSQVKVVYVRNLPENATQEHLWKLFEKHGEITKVMVPPSKPGQQKRDFGFVHFAERSSALKAIEKTEKYVLEGRLLETSIAKPQTEKRAGSSTAMNASVGAGILPQQQSRAAFGLSRPDPYGAMTSGFGSSRGYGQVQPVIYGRGPTPAGMSMVPMVLPDGRIGYVLQHANRDSPPASHRDDKASEHSQHSQRHSGSSKGSSSRRYRPY